MLQRMQWGGGWSVRERASQRSAVQRGNLLDLLYLPPQALYVQNNHPLDPLQYASSNSILPPGREACCSRSPRWHPLRLHHVRPASSPA